MAILTGSVSAADPNLLMQDKKTRSWCKKWVFKDGRLNVQLSHHFLDDMRLLANLLKDFDEP